MKLLTMVISDKSYSKFEKRKPVIQNEEIHFQLFRPKGIFFFKRKTLGSRIRKSKQKKSPLRAYHTKG